MTEIRTGCSGRSGVGALPNSPGWMSGAVREGFLEEVITVKWLATGAAVSEVDRGGTLSKGTALRKHVPWEDGERL